MTGQEMTEQEDTENEISVYDDPLIKALHHVDDGCCHLEPYLWDLNFRRFIHDGVYTPRPKPRRVTGPRLIPITKKRKTRKARKVNHEY